MAPRGPNASLSAWHGGDWNRGQEHEDASAPQSSGPSLVSRASPVRFGSWREELTASKSGPQYLNDQNYSLRPEMLPGRPSRPGEFSPESLTEPDATLSRHPTARSKATGRRIKIMRFRANYVSTSVSGGDYYQAMFAAEEDTNDSDSPYLIIQRQFEDPEDDTCYIETHNRKYSGHFLVRRIEFTPESLLVELDRPSDNPISVTFRLAPLEFEKASQVIKIISGEMEPRPE
jgi:hypothetical protein